MKEKFFIILNQARKVFGIYPLVLLSSFIMALITIIHITIFNFSKDDSLKFLLVKLILVAGLGISLNFALKLLAQRVQQSKMIEYLGILILIGFYFILPKNEVDFNEFYAFILIPIYILSHLLVAFIAFTKKENLEFSFWQFNKNLFVNFFLTLVFVSVLIIGTELAILAIDNLFEIHFDSDVYWKIFLFILIFGSTFIFLSFCESGLSSIEKEDEYPIILQFFTQYILIPLLFLYVVILYVYLAKIILTWELPRGWVSYLILAYSSVGILALLLVHPLKNKTEKAWVRVFGKLFYYTLIPLLILLFVAIFTRILAYSFTEPRYYVLLLAIWLSTVVLYFVFIKNATIKFIPISLFIFGLFALVFPYFNAISVAKRSQKNALEQILKDNKLLVNGKIDFDKTITDSLVYEISSKFDFLNSRGQSAFLLSFLDDKHQVEFKNAESNYWPIETKFKNVQQISNKNYPANFLQLTSKQPYYEIANYQYAILQQYPEDKNININQDSIQIKTLQNSALYMVLNNKDTLNLKPLAIKLFDNYPNNPDVLSIEGQLANYKIKVIFGTIEKTNVDANRIDFWFSNVVYLIDDTNKK
ncbi:MAG TPA: DUF4153 domain-containing protein [Chitinophagales bacterium]|nr:DUF4153 domain-containing protein [Chitinophagales bacterium]